MKLSLLCALAFLAGAAPAFGQSPKLAGNLKDMIAAASQEGTLDLVWSSTLLGGVDAAQQHAAAFNKEFGTHIDVKFSPGIEAARFGNQLYTEFKAGQPASSDLYAGAAAQLIPLLQGDLFMPVPWKSLEPAAIADQEIEADNKALRIQTALSGITYNTNLVKNPPHLLTDLLQPQWKGKIATTPYAAGYDILAANDLWGPKKTLDFVGQLSAQAAGLIRCGDVERIATGEFAALVMDCIDNATQVWRERGAPVGYAIPADAAQKRYYYVSIPKNARHPNAAALFSLYLVSAAGQDVMWNTVRAQLDSVPGAKVAKVIADNKAKGISFHEVTIAWWAQHPEIDATKTDMIKLLRRSN
jgi:ABC-type Fe3+ transport system substrate-binding protein